MKKELMTIGMLREEMQRFAENVIAEKEMFLREKSYKKSITTESIAFVVMSNKFYKKGFDLYSKTKNMRCFEESNFDVKLKYAYTAQFYVEIADKLMTAYSKEERPEYFEGNNGKDRLGVKGLLKLMNSGKFYRVEELINYYTFDMDVDKEYLSELCSHIDNMDIEEACDFVLNVLEVGLYTAFPTAKNRELSSPLKSAKLAVEAQKEAVLSSESLEEVVDYLIVDDEDECWEPQPISSDEIVKEVAISGGLLEKEDEVVDYVVVDEEWESQNISLEDRVKREIIRQSYEEDKSVDYLILDDNYESQNLSQEEITKRNIIREAYEFINGDCKTDVVEEKNEFTEKKTLHEMIEEIRAKKISEGLLEEENFDDSIFDVIIPSVEEDKSESPEISLTEYTVLPELEDVEVEIHIPYNTENDLESSEHKLNEYDFEAMDKKASLEYRKKHSISSILAKFFNIF